MRSLARQSRVLRQIWSDSHVLLNAYVRGLPDWLRWRLARRDYKASSTFGRPASSPSRGSLCIAFVSNKVTAREYKLAYAATLCGHHVVLITRQGKSGDAMMQHFDECLVASNPWRMLLLIDELHPDVIHTIVHEDNLWMLPVLLYADAPVVYDPYDCLQGMLEPEYQYSRWALMAERRWFAGADHICARSLEPRYLRRHCGYRIPSTTYFPEYCWQPPLRREPRQLHDSDDLHIVYCGGIWPEDRYSAAAAGYAQYIEIGRALAQQRIHLHLYPATPPAGTTYEIFFALYLQESARNPFFHIYPTLPYAELMRELPKYDAALHIMGVRVNQSLGSATRPKLDYSTANKLFDYIEAGLPVIIHNGRHQRGVVRHYGATVEITDIGEARGALLHVLRAGFSSKLSATIVTHADRLGFMYKYLVK